MVHKLSIELADVGNAETGPKMGHKVGALCGAEDLPFERELAEADSLVDCEDCKKRMGFIELQDPRILAAMR